MTTSPRHHLERRPNRLEAWRRVRSGSHWFIEYRGVQETVDHVIGVLPRAERVSVPSTDTEWPYRIRMDFEPDQSLDDFLDFLQEVLVIRIEQEGFLNAAIALDLYKHPVMSKSGEVVEYTETANLVRLIKGSPPATRDEVNRAGQTLCELLSNALLRHEWFNEATRILPVPGHDRDKPSIGVMLGALLSQEIGIPWTAVQSKTKYRKPVKKMSDRERAALLHEFRVDEDLTGQTVLIVDDVHHTGSTMAGVANAARQAGATTVLGLAMTKDLRR